MATKTAQEYEGYKKEVVNKFKSSNINRFKKEALGKLEFKQDITPVEKMGFESVLNEKYDFDLDENESPFIKDKKTGQRIASKKVIGQFMTAEEILNEELIANKLAKINKDGGKPAYQQNGNSQNGNQNQNGNGMFTPKFGKLFQTVKPPIVK